MSFEEAKAPGGNLHRYEEIALLGSFCCEATMLTHTVWMGPKLASYTKTYLDFLLEKSRLKKNQNKQTNWTRIKQKPLLNKSYSHLLFCSDYLDLNILTNCRMLNPDPNPNPIQQQTLLHYWWKQILPLNLLHVWLPLVEDLALAWW